MWERRSSGRQINFSSVYVVIRNLENDPVNYPCSLETRSNSPGLCLSWVQGHQSGQLCLGYWSYYLLHTRITHILSKQRCPCRWLGPHSPCCEEAHSGPDVARERLGSAAQSALQWFGPEKTAEQVLPPIVHLFRKFLVIFPQVLSSIACQYTY